MATIPAKRFEYLWIWQEAREVASGVLRDFATSIGAHDFGLRDQFNALARQ